MTPRRRHRGGKTKAAGGDARGTLTLESLALTLASGILLALPFLQPSLYFLHYLALVPWLILLTRRETRRAWLYFLLGVYVFFAMAYGPFSLLHKAIPFSIALFFAPPFLPFAFFVRPAYLRFRLPLTLLAPCAWVAAEWLRIRWAVGETGLYPLGASQAHLLPLIQIADLTGLAGVSFLVAAANGALADLWLARGQWSWRRLWPVSLVPALVAAALAYGGHRLRTLAWTEGPRLALVQPDMVHYRDPAKTWDLYAAELEFTRARVSPGAADLVAWPENAIDDLFDHDPGYLAGLQGLARELAAGVVAGAFTRAGEPGRIHTSAYYVAADGGLVGRYDKNYLIPWAEYTPFESWLGGLSPTLMGWNRALGEVLLGYRSLDLPGREITLFPIEARGRTWRFATPICYEVSNPEFARRAVDRGAHFLLNISSEGYMGPPVYHHMWSLATFRAVEGRVAIARAGNHGISGIIDPAGRPHRVLRGEKTGRPFLEPGVLIASIPLEPEPGSFYSRRGDLFTYLCLAVCLGLLGASWPRRPPG